MGAFGQPRISDRALAIRTVKCPTCHAGVGKKCIAVTGTKRVTHHRKRTIEAGVVPRPGQHTRQHLAPLTKPELIMLRLANEKLGKITGYTGNIATMPLAQAYRWKP